MATWPIGVLTLPLGGLRSLLPAAGEEAESVRPVQDGPEADPSQTTETRDDRRPAEQESETTQTAQAGSEDEEEEGGGTRETANNDKSEDGDQPPDSSHRFEAFEPGSLGGGGLTPLSGLGDEGGAPEGGGTDAGYAFENLLSGGGEPDQGGTGGTGAPPANGVPLALDDNAAGTEDTLLSLDPLANDSDPDGDMLTVVGVSGGANGTVSVGAGNTLVYQPDPDTNGADSFVYTISDGRGGTATAEVTVDVAAVNDAPVAADDATATAHDTPVQLDLFANDSDPEGGALTITGLTDPAQGSVSVVAGGVVEYTPEASAFGIDSFVYTVADSAGATATATVEVDVALPAATCFTVVEDSNLDDSFPASDATGALSYQLLGHTVLDFEEGRTRPQDPVDSPQNDLVLDNLFYSGLRPGTVYDNADSLDIEITAAGGRSFALQRATVFSRSDGGYDSALGVDVTFTAYDDAGNVIGSFDFTTDPADEGLSVIDFSGETGFDEAHRVTITRASSGPADPYFYFEDLQAEVLYVPGQLGLPHVENGDISLAADGTLSFAPDADYNGLEEFAYLVTDGTGATRIETAKIEVTPVNDAPVAITDMLSGTEDTVLAAMLDATDADLPYGDSIDFALAGDEAVHVVDFTRGNGLDPAGVYDGVEWNGFFHSSVVSGTVYLEAAGDGAVIGQITRFGGGPFSLTETDFFSRSDPGTDTATPFTVRLVGYSGGVEVGSVEITSDPVDAAVTHADFGSAFANVDRIDIVQIGAGEDYFYLDNTAVNTAPGPNAVTLTDFSTDTTQAGDEVGILDGIDWGSFQYSGSFPGHAFVETRNDGDVIGSVRAGLNGAGFGIGGLTVASRQDGGGDTATGMTVDFVGYRDGVEIGRVQVTTDPNDGTETAIDFGGAFDFVDRIDIVQVSGGDDYFYIDGIETVVNLQPAHGSVALDPDGELTYTPEAGFTGTDYVTYKVTDQAGAADYQTIEITVDPAAAASSSFVTFASIAEDGAPVMPEDLFDDGGGGASAPDGFFLPAPQPLLLPESLESDAALA